MKSNLGTQGPVGARPCSVTACWKGSVTIRNTRHKVHTLIFVIESKTVLRRLYIDGWRLSINQHTDLMAGWGFRPVSKWSIQNIKIPCLSLLCYLSFKESGYFPSLFCFRYKFKKQVIFQNKLVKYFSLYPFKNVVLSYFI